MDLCLISIRGTDALHHFTEGNNSANSEYQGVYWGVDVPEELRIGPMKMISTEALLEPSDFEEIDRTVWDLTRNWHENISPLGEFVEFDLQMFLLKRVKNLAIFSKCVSKYRPSRILCFDNTGQLWPVVEFYAKMTGISVLRGEVPQLDLASWEEKRTIKSWLVHQFTQRFLDPLVLGWVVFSRRYQSSVWIDVKLLSQLEGVEDRFTVLPCIMEKGLRVRLGLLKKRKGYFALRSKYRSGILPLSRNRFHVLWKRFDHDPAFRSFFSFRGINFYPIVRQELRAIFLSDFPRIRSNIQQVQSRARQLLSWGVVLRNESRELEKSCVVAAKETSLRSVVFQHGVFAIPIPDRKTQCDVSAVWGSFGCRYLQEQKHFRSKCVITGNPEYDRLTPEFRESLFRKKEWCRQLALDSHLPILILASQRPHSFSSKKTEDEQTRMVSAVMKALQQIPSAQLIVKIHPFENERPICHLVRNFTQNGRVRIVKNAELFSLLASSDALITCNSTVGLSAMVLGKPVLVVNLTGYPDTVPYVSSGAAVGVYQEESIAAAIEELLLGGKRVQEMLDSQKKFLGDYVFKIDGKSTNRVFQLLAEVSSRHKTSR